MNSWCGRKHPHQEFIQIDTTNILFICGGAFDGIEGIIQKRTGKQGMGFGSEVKGKEDEQTDRLLAKIEPHDLMKFGLIPELIGRLPAITRAQNGCPRSARRAGERDDRYHVPHSVRRDRLPRGDHAGRCGRYR